MSPVAVRATAPGRVNLIGEHTDHAGGLALPVAIDRGTTVTGTRHDRPGPIVVRSAIEPEPAVIDPAVADPAAQHPAWARLVAGVVAELRPATGFDGTVTTTLAVGAGLASSASLAVALALALGADSAPRPLAALAQRAEQRATGVPCGLMDQLAVTLGRPGHALAIDFATGAVEPVALPARAELVVVDSGRARTLAGSPYAERRRACERAAALLGPLGRATEAEVATLADPVLRRRARHVVTENARVRRVVAALGAGDLAAAGSALDAGHASLRDDFEVSTPELDALVTRVRARPGVHGVRLTGAGFGGCVIALAEPGALDVGWVVHAAAGATVTTRSV